MSRKPEYVYKVEVFINGNAGWIARLPNEDYADGESPLLGLGETPLEAMADLIRALCEWRHGGAEAWMSTPRGKALADHVMLGLPIPASKVGAT